MSLLESENRYPDCVWMKLEEIPIVSESTGKQQLDLYLTLQLNEQWETLLEGRVKFGCKSGELRLKLENGEFTAISGDFKHLFGEVTITGSPENPIWIFAGRIGEPVLQGLLQNVKLGTLQVTEKPCRVEATFTVSLSDVSLTDAEGLWRHDITPNKQAVIERQLIRFLWDAKLTPYLSRVQLCCDCLPYPSLVEAIAPQTLAELQSSIQQVSEAKTNDFLDLAKIANLDPMQDFAGANLRGTILSGIELGGANLSRVNLRGADLTDADLSEANLTGAKLSGADLSGAFLENVDLSYTDLHRASLALANLGSANLAGANLHEANLSNSNLGGANVKAAQFGNNPGLSQDVKLNLVQRGAIFHE